MAKAAKPKAPAKVPKPKASTAKAAKPSATAKKTQPAKASKTEPKTDVVGVVDTLYGLTLTVMGIAEFVADRDPGLADHLETVLGRKGSRSGPHLNFPRSVITELRNRKKPLRGPAQG